jgi:hypothetical protein
MNLIRFAVHAFTYLYCYLKLRANANDRRQTQYQCFCCTLVRFHFLLQTHTLRVSITCERSVAGVPASEQPNKFERKMKYSAIPQNLNLENLENFIVRLFPAVPQLSQIGFDLAKATKIRQLLIVNINSVAELRKEIKKGKLFIIPKQDLLPSHVVSDCEQQLNVGCAAYCYVR